MDTQDRGIALSRKASKLRTLIRLLDEAPDQKGGGCQDEEDNNFHRLPLALDMSDCVIKNAVWCLSDASKSENGTRLEGPILAATGGVAMERENSTANAIMSMVGIPLGLMFMTWTLMTTWTAFVGGQVPFLFLARSDTLSGVELS